MSDIYPEEWDTMCYFTNACNPEDVITPLPEGRGEGVGLYFCTYFLPSFTTIPL